MTEEKIKNFCRSEDGPLKEAASWPQHAALISLLLIIGIFAFSSLADYDFWWHLKVGELIYKTKDIVREDLFSFTSPGAYWIDHSWLAELGIYGAWRAGEIKGVLLLKAIFLVVTFSFLFGALSRGVKFNSSASSSLIPLLVIAGAAAATKVGWEVRPQTFSYLFFTLFLFLLETRKARYWLPLIIILWANSHGSFFFGLILVGAYTVEALVARYRKKVAHYFPPPTANHRDKEAKTLLILFLITFAASWINPHPLRLYAHPWIHLHQIFPREIAEWARPAFMDVPAFWGFLLFTLLSIPLALKKIRLAHALLFLVFLYPGLRYLRNVPYLTLAAAPLLGYTLAYSLKQAEEILPGLAKPLDKPSSGPLNPFYLLTAVFLLFALLALVTGWGGKGGVDYQRFPQKGVDFYQQNQVRGPLFNTYEWGGYLTFRLWPQEKVFIMGITSDEEIFRQYYHITEGKESWRALLDRYRINAILTKTCYEEGGMIPYISKLYLGENWWLVYQDDTACLLVKAAEENRYLERFSLPKEKLFLAVLVEERRLLKRKPLNPHALYFSALAQYVLGDNSGAQKNVNILLQANPASLEAEKLTKALQAGKNPQDFLRETYGQ